VSGTGVVADGIIWIDGWVSLKWRGSPSSVPATFESVDALLAVHGHGNKTRLRCFEDAKEHEVDRLRAELAIAPPDNDGPARVARFLRRLGIR
jgi:hypothetical protein